ncbi:MAG: tRNA (adenosine(37)-N6)-threonylcarbamoyltransferase complex transferase subunit TsaD [Flavobacteriales bacterium]
MERLLLAIESSCDDTSAAVLRGNRVLSNVVATQKLHEAYGGVVPELASRAHQSNIVPTVHTALEQAGVTLDDLEGVAFTQGPGLMGSLLVGTSFAKSLAQARALPVVGINHMEAHILAHFIADTPDQIMPNFPFLCLTVSGGHTQIVRVNSPTRFDVLGETTDDAAGEAFDKIAKIIGLPYPGGPLVDRNAKNGNPKAFAFPKSNVDGYGYSFSGLKTAVLYFLQKQVKANPNFIAENMEDLCASVQHTIVETLMDKLVLAAEELGITDVALAGGVSANSGLRQTLRDVGEAKGWRTFIPPFQYCTDNAAMIGMAGQFRLDAGQVAPLNAAPKARWTLESGRG